MLILLLTWSDSIICIICSYHLFYGALLTSYFIRLYAIFSRYNRFCVRSVWPIHISVPILILSIILTLECIFPDPHSEYVVSTDILLPHICVRKLISTSFSSSFILPLLVTFLTIIIHKGWYHHSNMNCKPCLIWQLFVLETTADSPPLIAPFHSY